MHASLQTAEDIDGKEQSMMQYSGKVLLITNVASQCGFTESNYKGLQKLYEKFQSRGFEVCTTHSQIPPMLDIIMSKEMSR